MLRMEWDGETKEIIASNGLQAGNNWRTNYLGQYNIFEFEVTRDAFANMGRGIASLDLSIQFDRDYDSIFGRWSETCEFTDTVNITILTLCLLKTLMFVRALVPNGSMVLLRLVIVDQK